MIGTSSLILFFRLLFLFFTNFTGITWFHFLEDGIEVVAVLVGVRLADYAVTRYVILGCHFSLSMRCLSTHPAVRAGVRGASFQ